MTSMDTQDYIPEDLRSPVSTMPDGLLNRTVPALDALTGTKLILLVGEEGRSDETCFLDTSSLIWIVSGPDAEISGTSSYNAIEAHSGIFLIDFVRDKGSDAENVTIIWDRNTGTVAIGCDSFCHRRR